MRGHRNFTAIVYRSTEGVSIQRRMTIWLCITPLQALGSWISDTKGICFNAMIWGVLRGTLTSFKQYPDHAQPGSVVAGRLRHDAYAGIAWQWSDVPVR